MCISHRTFRVVADIHAHLLAATRFATSTLTLNQNSWSPEFPFCMQTLHQHHADLLWCSCRPYVLLYYTNLCDCMNVSHFLLANKILQGIQSCVGVCSINTYFCCRLEFIKFYYTKLVLIDCFWQLLYREYIVKVEHSKL